MAHSIFVALAPCAGKHCWRYVIDMIFESYRMSHVFWQENDKLKEITRQICRKVSIIVRGLLIQSYQPAADTEIQGIFLAKLIKNREPFRRRLRFSIDNPMEKVISLIQYFSQTSEFEKIVHPYILKLYRVAYRLCGSASDAEDLVQDVLVKVYPKRQTLGSLENPGPWLVKVLYRTFIDQRRRMARSPLHFLQNNNDDENNSILESIPSKNSGPEEISENNQVRERLMQAINSLNLDQKHLCLLHDVEGYTLNELEEILDTPIGTLKSRLHRARASLRKILQHETF
jgi:RNA polymerase sigma-70 factor (ECF subfamily)